MAASDVVVDLDASTEPAPGDAPAVGGGVEAEGTGGDVPDVAAPGRSDPLRRVRGLVVAVGVLFALAAALAVTAGVLYSRLEAERGRTDDVERVAGQFAAAVASYDYRNLDAARDEVLALSTGGFRKDYESRFEDLRTVLEATKGSATTTVKAVYLGELEDDQATAFVIVDVNVEGTSGRRQLVNEYLELSLVRLDEGWKVDNVRNLNFGRRASSAAGAPSTTAPAAGTGAAPSG